jgi:hypothetical protein
LFDGMSTVIGVLLGMFCSVMSSVLSSLIQLDAPAQHCGIGTSRRHCELQLDAGQLLDRLTLYISLLNVSVTYWSVINWCMHQPSCT